MWATYLFSNSDFSIWYLKVLINPSCFKFKHFNIYYDFSLSQIFKGVCLKFPLIVYLLMIEDNYANLGS